MCAARTGAQIRKAYDQAEQTRRQWEGEWRDAYRFAMPQRDILNHPRPGQRKGVRVFDSTAVNSTHSFANRIQTSLFPPFEDFINLIPGPAVPKESKQEAGEILERVANVFHSAVHRSNFAVTINEFMLDLAAGTGAMMLQEGPDSDPFNFISVATPMVALEEGPFGGVGGIYRTYKLPLTVIEAQWPDIEVPKEWASVAQENPSTQFSFIEATYQDHKEDLWYYELLKDDGEEKLLKEPRVFEGSGPWIITRWSKAANETYGRGPLLFALHDIRTVNRVVELILQNASLSVAGVYTVADDGVTNPNTIKFRPGTFIPVRDNPGSPRGASIAPLPTSGDFDLSQILLADLRESIKRALFDKALPEPQGTPMSATETIQRLREFTIDTGPAFGRIMDELVTPLVMRGLQILNRKGMIQFPFQIDGQSIQVQVTSPLARQQGLDKVETVMRALELTSFLGPEAVNLNYKVEEDIPVFIAEAMGVPASLMRDAPEKDEKKQEAQLMQAAQIAAEAAQAQGGGAGGGQGEAPPAEPEEEAAPAPGIAVEPEEADDLEFEDEAA